MLESAQDAFQIIISIGAGTGLLYLLRWFWWRINAWSEVVAMISSFAISVVFFVAGKSRLRAAVRADDPLSRSAFTTVCWLLAAFVSPQTDRATLIAFYREGASRRARAGAQIRREAGVSEAEAARHGDTWAWRRSAGCPAALTIWSSLFAIGNFLYGRMGLALTLTAVFVVSGADVALRDQSPVGSGR